MTELAEASAGVTVSGHGGAAAAPDVVRLALAAEASAGSVSDALERASAGVSAMRSALVQGGVAETDLRTTETALWSDNGPTGRGPVRHTTRLGLQATVRELAAAGRLLATALAAAGDSGRSNGLSFAHSDPTALRATAREAAFRDAQARAEQLAALAGRPLGAVREVVEVDASAPVPVGRAYAMVASAEPVPVDAGEQEVRAAVTVSWDWAASSSGPPISGTVPRS